VAGRLVTAFLALLTILMVAGFLLSVVGLLAPVGCSDDDLGCSIGSGEVAELAGIGIVVFGPLSLLSGWGLQAWCHRRFWD
jgi:uncharacterized membrane protein